MISKYINALRVSMNTFMDDNFSAYTIVYDENFADPETFAPGSKWITPIYGEGDILPTDAVKSIEFYVYCFSKGDPEGLELSEMLDAVVAAFLDETQNDGKKRIPMVSVETGTPVQISTIMALDIAVERSYKLGDSTSVQSVVAILQWC